MITVFGSINVDLTFQVAHLPDAGETVLTPSFSQAVGGKGANQAIAAARDGSPVRFVGCVGSDAFGETARRALSEAGIDIGGLATVQGPTGVAAVLVDPQGRNKIVVASGANGALRAQALAGRALSREDLLVLQMESPTAEVEAVIARAAKVGARIILNLAPALPLPLESLRRVNILIVNEHEAATLCAALKLSVAEPAGQLVTLAKTLGNTVILTLGEKGAIGARGDERWQVAAMQVVAIDTTGAGDCFVGVLAAALERGQALPRAMQRAAVAASLACTVVGASPSFPAREAIDAALARSGSGSA
jgi:ribokinase